MPTQTFLNLAPEKRERIVELALEEFSERPYAQASLSRIVARAGIAKGSIYQYFADKLDLYRWLVIEEVGRRKQAFFAGVPVTSEGPLRERLRGMSVVGLQFALAHPRLARVAAHTLAATGEPGLQALHAEMRALGRRHMEAMLRAAQASGELRADVAVGPAALLLAATLGPGLMDALLERLGLGQEEFLADTRLAARLSRTDVEALVDSVLDVIWRGLAP